MPDQMNNPHATQSEINEGVYSLVDPTTRQVLAVVSIHRPDGMGYPMNGREYWDLVHHPHGNAAYTEYKDPQGAGAAGTETEKWQWVYSGPWQGAWGDGHPPVPPPHHKWDAANNVYALGTPTGVEFVRWVHSTFRALAPFVAP